MVSRIQKDLKILSQIFPNFFLALYSILKFLISSSFTICRQTQMVGLVFFDVPGNVLMPLVSTFTIKIHVWNMWIDNHIVSIFDFIKKIMASDGVILLFHLDDFAFARKSSHVWKAITSRFTWSVQLLIFSHLLTQKTFPWRYGSNSFPILLFSDALPSHGVKPTWGFHKVKLRKVKTWRHSPGFQL